MREASRYCITELREHLRRNRESKAIPAAETRPTLRILVWARRYLHENSVSAKFCYGAKLGCLREDTLLLRVLPNSWLELYDMKGLTEFLGFQNNVAIKSDHTYLQRRGLR
jgi:hypothetical protein